MLDVRRVMPFVAEFTTDAARVRRPINSTVGATQRPIFFPAGPGSPLADEHRQERARAWLRGLTSLAMRIIRLSPRSRE
jgi:hypothetical protein